jgi:hypothetical protein
MDGALDPFLKAFLMQYGSWYFAAQDLKAVNQLL